MAFISKQHSKQRSTQPGEQPGTGGGDTAASLLAQLDSADATARRAAARALRAHPQACAALAARLPDETDPAARAAIVDSLAHLGGDAAADALLGCLRSDDTALRNDAIDALKAMPAEVAPVMHALLADPDADVRIFAVNILESLRHPEVESWLIDVIEQDRHVNVVCCALDLLAEVGTSAALPALHAVRERFPGEPYLDFACALAITRCETPRP